MNFMKRGAKNPITQGQLFPAPVGPCCEKPKLVLLEVLAVNVDGIGIIVRQAAVAEQAADVAELLGIDDVSGGGAVEVKIKEVAWARKGLAGFAGGCARLGVDFASILEMGGGSRGRRGGKPNFFFLEFQNFYGLRLQNGTKEGWQAKRMGVGELAKMGGFEFLEISRKGKVRTQIVGMELLVELDNPLPKMLRLRCTDEALTMTNSWDVSIRAAAVVLDRDRYDYKPVPNVVPFAWSVALKKPRCYKLFDILDSIPNTTQATAGREGHGEHPYHTTPDECEKEGLGWWFQEAHSGISCGGVGAIVGDGAPSAIAPMAASQVWLKVQWFGMHIFYVSLASV
ncbi:hypothetical protein BDK51DRAFT_29301 [Blyttiomyces helicus]|uniref:Uncharacterized protein n=1 Tax=Blyttiomyces helicus TaxID=388810 RepID=A0A4P9WMK5_9FUNG|nr:hypothetical protein BDK51DRAFT_29301 [Blyttiomyces helicus]|eukprot:RKO91966.1 hypothetical protein BDK51DRAFT_29301 [Blyttiomyces helicus]